MRVPLPCLVDRHVLAPYDIVDLHMVEVTGRSRFLAFLEPTRSHSSNGPFEDQTGGALWDSMNMFVNSGKAIGGPSAHQQGGIIG